MYSNVPGEEPTKEVQIIVGLDGNLSFCDLTATGPEPLDLDLSDRCVLQFRLSDDLLQKGWRFQQTPISFQNDWGQNFSSFYWTSFPNATDPIPYSQFKVIYENKRMGIFFYSLFMLDARGQPIDLDPKIENGTGN